MTSNDGREVASARLQSRARRVGCHDSMRRFAPLLVAAPLTSAPPPGAGPRAASATVQAPPRDTLWLENASIRLGFDPSNGSLQDVTDRATAQSFLEARAARTAAGIWQLDRLAPGASALVPSSARTFSWHRLAGERPGLALVWSDFGLTEAPALRVTAAVRLYRDSSLSEWRIVVGSLGPLAVEQVRFPRLTGMRQLGAREELAVPRWMGALARDPAMLLAGPDGKGRRIEWSYPGTLSLQVIALYRRGGGGLYAAADDTLAYRKTFAVWGDSNGSRGYELGYPPGLGERRGGEEGRYLGGADYLKKKKKDIEREWR